MKTTLISTIQEITLQAHELGIYGLLFNEKNMSRDAIFETFRAWADEFNDIEKEHAGEPDWFYYDEIDRFLVRKKKAIDADNPVPGLTWEDVMEIYTIAKGPLEQKAPGVEAYFTEALRIFNARRAMKE